MLIITGTGRSGTELMARIFGGFHEFRVNYILDKYFSSEDPHSDLFDTVKKRITVILDLHQGVDRETFVDSSNLYIHFIDAIYLLNPLAKFILAVRNGKDFARSAISRKWHERKSFGMVPQYNDTYFDKWEGMNPLQRSAWIWAYRNRKALEGLDRVPEKQKLILRIEDLKSHETLDIVESFTGIKIEDRGIVDKRFNANPFFDFNKKEEWTVEQNSEFYEIAGEMMKFFRYE